PGSSRVDVGEVHFLDAAFGWAPVSQDCGDHTCVVVYVSDDGGGSWLPRTDRPVAVGDGTNGWVAAVPAVRLATKDIGWLIDVEGNLYSTTNGARTWRPERTEGAVVALEAHGESVWRLEQSCPESDARCRYAWLTSNDYGGDWRPAQPPPPMGPSGVSSTGVSLVRPSARVAYVLSDSGDYPAAGHPGDPRPEEWKPDPLLARTEDGGRTWTEMRPPCPAIGKGGSWGADLAASTPEDLWLVCHDDAYSGAMQPKHLYRSTDGAESWSEDLGTPNAGSGGKTAAASPTRACRGGSRTGIACTRDGGRSWFFPIGGAENPRDGGVHVAQFVDDRHGWAIAQDNDSGNHNVLWRTTDGGESWSPTRIAS
ncbi:MAG: glycoside hydrolase, partial [Actinomycetota bacterium]|nr:glycoside hydrolase [Actinomycetota bacterium]